MRIFPFLLILFPLTSGCQRFNFVKMTKMVTKCDDKNMKLTKPIGSLHNASYLWDVVCHKSRYRCMLMRTYKITVCRSLKTNRAIELNLTTGQLKQVSPPKE